MELDLKGRRALVTGGSYGIGKAIALALAKEGCNVAICARHEDKLEKTLQIIKKTGVDALAIKGDLHLLKDIEKVVETVKAKWKTIDILINNVGGGGGRSPESSIEKVPEDVWVKAFEINVLAAIRFTNLVIPFMRQQQWGRVITIASIQGKEGGGRPWYNLAKSAEISLMKTLAMNTDLVRKGITFNTVAPGAILWEGNEWDIFRLEDSKKFNDKIDTKLPLGRIGSPEEVANVVTFICSEKARLVNGVCIPVDGAESRSF